MIDTAAQYVDLLLAVIALLGVIKSAWNGMLRQIYIALREVPEMHNEMRKISGMKEKVDDLYEQHKEFEETQNEMKDAIIALARSQNDEDVETNPEKFQRRLSDNHSADFTRKVRADDPEDD